MVFSFCNISRNNDDRSTSPLDQAWGIPEFNPGNTGRGTSMVASNDEIAGLSAEERDTAYNELHCIPNSHTEHPDEIQQALYELDCQLDKLKTNNHSFITGSPEGAEAYRLAEAQNKGYVHNRQFRLMFLRAEKYHPRLAAGRMLRFFAEKMRLFGEEKLTQEIMYQDLDPETAECVESGFLQFCPMRDRAGRKIFMAFLRRRMRHHSQLTVLRAHFYFLMVSMEEEADQMKGLSLILFIHRDQSANSQQQQLMRNWSLANLAHALPLRFGGLHACMENHAMTSAFKVCISYLDKMSKFLARFHVGTHLETMYSLLGFGIPTDALPFEGEDGEVSLDNHLRWVDKQKTLEKEKLKQVLDTLDMDIEMMDDFLDKTSSGDHLQAPVAAKSGKDMGTTSSSVDRGAGLDQYNLGNLLLQHPSPDKNKSGHAVLSPVPVGSGGELITKPTTNDVLLGRGTPLRRHPGNVRFRDMVLTRLEEYDAAGRMRKSIMSSEVVDAIKSSRGRFLRPIHDEKNGPFRLSDDVVWEEVDDEAAHQKVAFTFRSFRKKNRKSS